MVRNDIEYTIRTLKADYQKTGDPAKYAQLQVLEPLVEKLEEETKYNGWTNYETWNCKLWLDNDYGTYQYIREESQRIYNEAEASEYLTKEQSALYNLSEFIKEYVEENTPEIDASMYSDMMNAAISEINWREIAKAYIDDIE